MKKKKIIVACSSYYPDIKGGGEISTQYLVETLSRFGFNVVVLAISNQNALEEINGLKVYRVAHKNLYWSYRKSTAGFLKKIAWHLLDSSNPFIVKEMMKIILLEMPDILITSTIEDVSSLLWKSAKENNIRTIHILRSYSMACTNANMFKNGKRCISQCASCKTFTFLKRMNSAYVDDVVGISHFVLNRHVQLGYFNHAKKHVINNIVNVDLADTSEESQSMSWISGKKEIVLGYIGNLLPTKGIEELIKAIGKTENPDIYKLYIAGKGDKSYTKYLETLAVEHKIEAVFMGHTQPEKFFDKINWLIIPSVWDEPFGRIIIEAYMYNTPVICSKYGGMPEIVFNDTGIVFNNFDDLTLIIDSLRTDTFTFDFSCLMKFTPQHIGKLWEKLLD